MLSSSSTDRQFLDEQNEQNDISTRVYSPSTAGIPRESQEHYEPR